MMEGMMSAFSNTPDAAELTERTVNAIGARVHVFEHELAAAKNLREINTIEKVVSSSPFCKEIARHA